MRSPTLAFKIATLAAAFAITAFVFGADNKSVLDNSVAGGGDGSMPVSKSWTLEKILALNHDQIIQMWGTLPPVPMQELNGHYMGLVPNAGDKKRQASAAAYMFDENSLRGYWLGKAFKQTGANQGEGHNLWRFPGGRIVHNLRFSTTVGTSLIDGRPSLLMDYGAFNSSTLIDELRKLDNYVYLGAATQRTSDGKRTQPEHFALLGPTDGWIAPSSETAEKK